MKKLGLLATVIAAIAFPAPPALAIDDFVVAIRLEKPAEDFLTVGSTVVTVIEYTSNFVAEIDLDGGPPVSVVLIPLSWEVISAVGSAMFNKVELKKDGFTKGVKGSLLAVGFNEESPVFSACPGFAFGVIGDLDNVVCVPIKIDTLRCSGGSKLVAKGKVHLKMTLDVDFDSQTDIPMGLGINLKLRDPDGCP